MWQDEDKRSKHHRNVDSIRSLILTKGYLDAGFGRYEPRAMIVTGSHVLKDGIPRFPMARSSIYQVLILYTFVFAAGPN